MAASPPPPNALLPLGELRSTRAGDLPEPLLRRYYTEDRGREWRLYLDAQSRSALIEDRGRRLLSRRSDPNIVRDMVRVAEHRGWRAIDARGSQAFRREAWLAGRAAGLEVRGHRPTERDLQELERRKAARERQAERLGDGQDRAATSRLAAVETLARARLADPAAQDRLIARARSRIAGWLERGARFEPWPPPERARTGHEPRERRRTH